jgi:hypothetical protein
MDVIFNSLRKHGIISVDSKMLSTARSGMEETKVRVMKHVWEITSKFKGLEKEDSLRLKESMFS